MSTSNHLDLFDAFVYVIGCEPADWAKKPPLVKIGWAKDVERRLSSLSAGSPLTLKVLRTYPGGPRMESWLHSNFAVFRDHGEWFRMASEEMLDRIDAAVERYSHGDDRTDEVIHASLVPNPEALARYHAHRDRRLRVTHVTSDSGRT